MAPRHVIWLIAMWDSVYENSPENVPIVFSLPHGSVTTVQKVAKAAAINVNENIIVQVEVGQIQMMVKQQAVS